MHLPRRKAAATPVNEMEALPRRPLSAVAAGGLAFLLPSATGMVGMAG
jgi:hypothetical protein